MTPGAPPARPGVLRAAARPLWVAARGGVAAAVGLALVGQALALLQWLTVGVYGLLSWSKIGLLTSLLALRTEVVATVTGIPGVAQRGVIGRVETYQWRLVPGLLTIGFVWAVAAGPGRRAARAFEGRSALAAAALAAAGAAVPIGALAALGAAAVRLSFPGIGMRLHPDPASAALWASALGGVASAAGAFGQAGRRTTAAVAIVSGATAYLWALGLVLVGVVMIATLEPDVTGAYVRALADLGPAGVALFAAHVLVVPAQNALLLVPAAGACLRLDHLGESFVRLCPWSLDAAERFDVPDLTPWFWLLSAVPLVGAMLAGRWAVRRQDGRATVCWGVAAGLVFAGLLVGGAWFAAPELLLPVVVFVSPEFTLRPDWVSFALVALGWGAAGGLAGALSGRR